MRQQRRKAKRIGGIILAAALVMGLGAWLWQGVCQIFWGAAAALLALPIARRLEKRMKQGMAAALALLAVGMFAAAFLLLALPPLVDQLRKLLSMLPALMESAADILRRGQQWLARSGVVLDGNMQGLLLAEGREILSRAAPEVAGWVGGVADGIGQWMLAPVFAFYFLRDRRRIIRRLNMLVPALRRCAIRRIFGEMRREVAGYLRGQLLISAMVGGLTAAGLLLCGVEGWLALGIAMGVLELIPYAGPFLGGLLAVLFALPGGATRVLWTLGVVIAVQQAEGSFLSPRLLSAATQLHPLTVIVCVTLGSAAAGLWGMLFSVPLLLCARAALRVMGEEKMESLRR